jgi:hypothetical protein
MSEPVVSRSATGWLKEIIKRANKEGVFGQFEISDPIATVDQPDIIYVTIESLEYPMWFTTASFSKSEILLLRSPQAVANIVRIRIAQAIYQLERTIETNEMTPFRAAVRKTQHQQGQDLRASFGESLRRKRG